MIYTMKYVMVYTMVYTMVYILCYIQCYKYLWILSSKTMSWQIKWIAASYWPAPVFFTFPLKSRPCPQMSPISVWHMARDCCKDAVQFCDGKAITLFGWNGKLRLHVFSKLSKL